MKINGNKSTLNDVFIIAERKAKYYISVIYCTCFHMYNASQKNDIISLRDHRIRKYISLEFNFF